MRLRASSMTSSVCTQTSPSGCHSGSCGQPTQRLELREQRVDDAELAARARSRSTACARGAAASRFLPTRARPAGRRAEWCGRAPSCRSSIANSNRAANWTARSTRRLSSPNVAGVHGAQHAALEIARVRRTDRRYSPVSGSQAMALMVKSRRRAASSIDSAGSPVTVKPLCPRPVFDSRRGSDTSSPATL